MIVRIPDTVLDAFLARIATLPIRIDVSRPEGINTRTLDWGHNSVPAAEVRLTVQLDARREEVRTQYNHVCNRLLGAVAWTMGCKKSDLERDCGGNVDFEVDGKMVHERLPSRVPSCP